MIPYIILLYVISMMIEFSLDIFDPIVENKLPDKIEGNKHHFNRVVWRRRWTGEEYGNSSSYTLRD